MNKKMFQNPEHCKALTESESPLWFWNDKLEKEELLCQTEMTSDIDVTYNIPHVRVGYGGYFDEEWMGYIQTGPEYKKKHDEPVWLYDEFTWPAGTCNREFTKKEEFCEQYLTFRKIQ